MTNASPLLELPLAALHRERNARLVPFAGYAMPVHYAQGILAEHLHTRGRASLFDVSHMGAISVAGTGAAAALESLLPADLCGLSVGRQRYTFFTNDTGGVRDDLMIARLDADTFWLIVNAAHKHDDLKWLQTQLAHQGLRIAAHFDRALLALQGPAAAAVLAHSMPASTAMRFMDVLRVPFENTECVVSRSGYTGEDGFEISLPSAHAEQLARRLLAAPEVALAGLGARDSLRLEAGLCLCGSDLDETISPIEAGLAWAIAPVRRAGGARAGGFPGTDRIAHELAHGCAQQRVGLRPEGRAPLRAGQALTDLQGQAAGRISSGGFGATVDGPIAFAYVERAHTAPDTRLLARVRDQIRSCRVVPLPFVPHRYVRESKP